MQNSKGFTLVELMVVIAIIAILAVGSITGYSAYIKKARDNTRVTELKAVENALTAFYVDNGTVVTDLDTTPDSSKDEADAAVLAVNGKVPTQPNTSGEISTSINGATVTGFQYTQCDNTNDFLVRVSFESGNIGQATKDRNPNTTNILELGTTTLEACDTSDTDDSDSSDDTFAWVTLADSAD